MNFLINREDKNFVLSVQINKSVPVDIHIVHGLFKPEGHGDDDAFLLGLNIGSIDELRAMSLGHREIRSPISGSKVALTAGNTLHQNLSETLFSDPLLRSGNPKYYYAVLTTPTGERLYSRLYGRSYSRLGELVTCTVQPLTDRFFEVQTKAVSPKEPEEKEVIFEDCSFVAEETEANRHEHKRREYRWSFYSIEIVATIVSALMMLLFVGFCWYGFFSCCCKRTPSSHAVVYRDAAPRVEVCAGRSCRSSGHCCH